MHISRCHLCTGKAYSPSHRFFFPETKLWPSDSESPPATSQATEAGWEKRWEKEKKRSGEGGQEEKGKRQ